MKRKNRKLLGTCHCGNLSFELRTKIEPSEIRARACDCSFCRLHGARTWSDPQGQAAIRIVEPQYLQKYRFGLRTADFYICRTCGAYLGAVLSDVDGIWSTLNLRLTDLAVEEQGASYGAEDAFSRIARRKRDWTPTIIE